MRAHQAGHLAVAQHAIAAAVDRYCGAWPACSISVCLKVLDSACMLHTSAAGGNEGLMSIPRLCYPSNLPQIACCRMCAASACCRWGRETFEHLVSLVHSEDAVQAGVQLCYAHCLFLASEPDPFWANSVHGFRRMSEQVGACGIKFSARMWFACTAVQYGTGACCATASMASGACQHSACVSKCS